MTHEPDNADVAIAGIRKIVNPDGGTLTSVVFRQCDGCMDRDESCDSRLVIDVTHAMAIVTSNGWLLVGLVEAWNVAADALGWTVSKRSADLQITASGIIPHARAHVRCPWCSR